MRPNSEYLEKSSAFWAYAKLLSEQLGYSRGNKVLSYSKTQAVAKLHQIGINTDNSILEDVLDYLEYRADILNTTVQHNLMDLPIARQTFYKVYEFYKQNRFTSGLPFNKQKNEKKDVAYFTGIINIVTEKTLREFARTNNLDYGTDVVYDFNPMNLSYFLSENKSLEGIMSRRFDGAYPSIVNPSLIWEIKEYYYTTTFGSRIADGVYETQLDGYEVKTIRVETGHKMKHIYFIDAYDTWWNMGKSYLCRIMDMLHTGLVDEVIVGKEVFERWPKVLQNTLEKQLK
ncbi:DUF7687 domain-containing protein [Cohnella panacarvi]|uniref:DUF7687 domain-containing protein n=1 Tax=Cohnella panacarvi TaxID=400776 RepID=UPI00047C611D|nr:hypothetical protein [Cohnella panacarvi]